MFSQMSFLYTETVSFEQLRRVQPSIDRLIKHGDRIRVYSRFVLAWE